MRALYIGGPGGFLFFSCFFTQPSFITIEYIVSTEPPPPYTQNRVNPNNPNREPCSLSV